VVEQTPFFLIVLIIYFSERGAKWKFLFTFCPSEAKRGEYSATLRRYQEAKPPLDTSRQAARRIHLIISSLFLSYFNVNSLSKSQRKFKELKNLSFTCGKEHKLATAPPSAPRPGAAAAEFEPYAKRAKVEHIRIAATVSNLLHGY